MKLNCLLVSEDLDNRRTVSEMLHGITEPQLECTIIGISEVNTLLLSEEIDVLFWDNTTLGEEGVDMLAQLSERPTTVFIAPTNIFAQQCFDLEILDYLLTPLEENRFLTAIQRISESMRVRGKEEVLSDSEPTSEKKEYPYFFVKADYKIVKVNFTDILYIESLREYVRIHTKQDKLMTLLTMNKILEILPKHQFFRIHRSTIINIDEIHFIQGNIVSIGKSQLTISKGQKESFLQLVNRYGLF